MKKTFLLYGQNVELFEPLLKDLFPKHSFYNLRDYDKNKHEPVDIFVFSAKKIMSRGSASRNIDFFKSELGNKTSKVLIASVNGDMLNQVKNLADKIMVNPLFSPNSMEEASVKKERWRKTWKTAIDELIQQN